ncbi:calcium-binding protein, partial [Aurantiacibacter flavus]
IQDDSHGWGGGYGGTDTLQFGAGIDPADVIVTQANNGNDYVLSIIGTTDKVTLSEAKSNNAAAIENVVFADGTIWSKSDLLPMSSQQSAAMQSSSALSSFAALASDGGMEQPLEVRSAQGGGVDPTPELSRKLTMIRDDMGAFGGGGELSPMPLFQQADPLPQLYA